MIKFIDLVNKKMLEYESIYGPEVKEKNRYEYSPGMRGKYVKKLRERHTLERKLGIFKHILR